MNQELSDRLSSFLRHPFVMMAALGLGIRFILMPLLTFTTDMAFWTRISNIADSGFGLYEVSGYFYTPVWGCIMAVTTALCSLFGVDTYGTVIPELLQYQDADFVVSPIITSTGYNLMVKIPLVIIDLAVAYCLYRLVEDMTDDSRKAVLVSGLWFLCPLVIEESSVHGMFDNMSALLMLLTVIMVRKSNYFWAGAAFGTAVLTKFFPIFMMFFLIAWVFRREGFGRAGYTALTKAIAGAVAAFTIIEMPAVMNGMFWESLFFLTDRIGISTEAVKMIFTPGKTIALLLILAAVLFLLSRYNRRFEGGIIQHIADADPVKRDRFVVRSMAVLFSAVTAVVLISAVMTVGGDSATELFSSIGMKFVTVLSVASLLLEGYLSYRLMFYGDASDKRVFGIALLSAMAIFLWPPAPQYIMVVLPFIALYCGMCSGKMVRPFLAFTVLMTLFQCVLGGVSCLFPVFYEHFGNIDVFLPVLDFMTSYIGPIPTIGVLMLLVGGPAYLAMLNISYRAVKEGAYV